MNDSVGTEDDIIQIEKMSADQFAGAVVLILGAIGSLLLVVWQSKCHCKVNLCYICQCERRPPNEEELKTLADEAKSMKDKQKKINKKEDIILDKEEQILDKQKSFDYEAELKKLLPPPPTPSAPPPVEETQLVPQSSSLSVVSQELVPEPEPHIDESLGETLKEVKIEK